MLYLITGRSGCGKSEEIIDRISRVLSMGRRAFLLVPEQQSIVAEKQLLRALGNASNMLCEVLNFERLPERVMRDIGGVKETYIDRSGRDLLMKGVLKELSPAMKQYCYPEQSAEFVRRILDEVENLKRQAISPDMLSKMSDAVRDSNGMLSDKLSDLALISARYAMCFTEVLDPTDNTMRLVAKLGNPSDDGYNFFDGADIFVDGYYTFTGSERILLGALMKRCANMHVTFCTGEELFFRNQRNEAERLLREAQRLGIKSQLTECTRNIRHKSSLATLEKYIWADDAGETADLPDDSVRIVECDDVFSESTAAAAEVLRLVKLGYRYRDIGVAVRRSDLYAGIADAMFRKLGIDCFMSVQQDLSSVSAAAIVCAAAELAANDFSLQSVKKYIKSPYCVLSRDESDALDKYITMWSMRSYGAYQRVWTRPCNGFSAEISDRDRRELDFINSIRKKLVASVAPLMSVLRSSKLTYSDGAKALYDHLISVGADEKLYSQAQAYRESGDEDECSKLTSVWDAVMALLDQLHIVGGQAPTDANGFSEAVKLMMSEYDYGRIPTSADEVQIGEASFMRFDEIKALIVLGVNEGIFPGAPSDDGLFSESERRTLEQLDFDTSMSITDRLLLEQFIFYRTVSAPSECLTLFYSSADASGAPLRPSAAIGRIKRIFPSLRVVIPSQNPDFLIQNEFLAREFPNLLPDSLRSIYETKKPSDEPVSLRRESVSQVHLTPSGIERYSKCPFSFYATDLLRLRELKTGEFALSDAGTFVHAVLERTLSELKDSISSADDNAIEECVNRAGEELAKALSPESDKRFENTVKRLCKMCAEIVKNIRGEFAASEFVPTEIEYKVAGRNAGLDLHGIIDRVDTCEIDGTTYVKITDYKTGTKKLTVSALLDGLSLQLFVYLFAYCDENKARKPAAVLYMPAVMPTSQDGSDAQAVMRRSGLVLGEERITRALEDPPGKYMPFGVKKDGTYTKNSGTVQSGCFDNIRRFIDGYVMFVGERIRNGEIPVSPLKSGEDACEYCRMRPFCRVTDDLGRDKAVLSDGLTEIADVIRGEMQ